MKYLLADDAHDVWTDGDVIEVKREAEALAIVTPAFTLLVSPLNEFAEKVVDLLSNEDRKDGNA